MSRCVWTPHRNQKPAGHSADRLERQCRRQKIERAIAAPVSIATAYGLTVDDAIVLHDSNRLTLRLMPCDIVARVAPMAYQADSGLRGRARPAARGTRQPGGGAGASSRTTRPRARRLRDQHVDVLRICATPTDPARRLRAARSSVCMTACGTSISRHRISRTELAEAEQLVASRDQTPTLAGADRELLSTALRTFKPAIGDRPNRGAAAARRATPGERARDNERAALHRPRDLLPRADRVRPRPRARCGE